MSKTDPVRPEPRARTSTTSLISQVHFALRERTDAALRKYAVTGIQYTVLSVVAARDGLSSADLSRRFFVTPQSMGQLLTTLERRGLLVRNEDADNRRVLRVSLTRAGRALVDAGAKDLAVVERTALAGINDADAHRLRATLRTLVAALRGSAAADRND